MKKYVKPDVVFEGFELSQHIAGACGIAMNSGDTVSCVTTGQGGSGDYFVPGPGFFAPSGQCSEVIEGEVCYYNSVDGFGIFTS